VLFVWAFARVALAAFSQKTIRSLDLEYQRRDGVDSPEGSRCSFAFCELTSAATAHVFELGTAQTLNGWSRSEARKAVGLEE